MTADADHGPQLDALLVADVEHALEEAPRVRAWVGALGEGDSLGHLDDAENSDLGGSPVGDASTDADEVARRSRVGERQEDPVRLRRGRRPSGPSWPRASLSSASRGTA